MIENNIIKSKFKKKINEVLEIETSLKFLLYEIFVYGSAYIIGGFLRDLINDKKSRDIDILVDIIKEKKTLKNYIDFCDLLENLFKNNKIDIVSKKGLSEFIGPHILKEVDYVKI